MIDLATKYVPRSGGINSSWMLDINASMRLGQCFAAVQDTKHHNTIPFFKTNPDTKQTELN